MDVGRLTKALHKLPTGVAQDIFGWTYELLQSLAAVGELPNLLLAIFQALWKGSLPTGVVHLWSWGRITPIAKAAGSSG
eukprot:7347067-Prorocentrum_lima.AAC.1